MKRSRLLPDFVFLDVLGSTHALRDVLGDLTVLAFTRCDRIMHGLAAEWFTAIVAENHGVNSSDVRGIDIHWSHAHCPEHDTCHLVDVHGHVLTLCDATGAIRRLYGVQGEDLLFLIGPDCHVIDSASTRDIVRFRTQLSLDLVLGKLGAARVQPRELSARNAETSRAPPERETSGIPSASGASRGHASGQ